jgi:hypothetical protein
MNTKNEITYPKIIVYALLTELTLIVIQFVYLKIYTNVNLETEFGFTSEYFFYS